MSDFVDDLYISLTTEIVNLSLILESYDNFRRTYGNIKWKTKEGNQIPLMHIGTYHLINIINMLKRNNYHKETIRIFEKELEIRQRYDLLKRQLQECRETLNTVY